MNAIYLLNNDGISQKECDAVQLYSLLYENNEHSVASVTTASTV